MTSIAEARRAVAAAALELRMAELALAEAVAANALPPEPQADGSTVRFRVQYRPGEKTYTYVALKADGKWLVTGQRYAGRKLSWEEVVYIADKNHAGRAHFENIT